MLLQALHRDRQQRLELWQVRWFIISIFMVLSQVPEIFMGCLCFRYMNSQECLVGPGTDFLADYKLLLRADLDTFPTPRFRGLWPEGVLVDRNYQTNFGLRRWFTQEWEYCAKKWFEYFAASSTPCARLPVRLASSIVAGTILAPHGQSSSSSSSS